MPKYLVGIREVHVSHREIEADSPEEAIERAGDEGREVFLEYSHTLDSETWTVEEVTNDNKSEGPQ